MPDGSTFPSQNARISVDLGGDMAVSKKRKIRMFWMVVTARCRTKGGPCQIGIHCIPISLCRRQLYPRIG